MTEIACREGWQRSGGHGYADLDVRDVMDFNTTARPGTLAPSILIAGTLLLYAGPAPGTVTEFVVPAGPEINLQDGRVIDGHIIRIDQTDIVIRTSDGASETVARSTVESVMFETVTGRQLTGELIGWRPGVYQITTPEAAIKVYSTMPATWAPVSPAVADTDTDEQETVSEETPPEGQELAAADGREAPGIATDVGQGGTLAIDEATAEETAANGVADEPLEDTVDVQDAAATPQAEIRIQVSVENSKESGPPVAFNVELSEPSDNSVVLIYATIDGTAVDGEDYEANRGVVVIKPGEQAARIEAPVIDDAEREEQEHLQLFLTVDPTVAVVENRQIIATIDDDDG